MANYWVDLGVATRPGSAGLVGDPLGRAELVTVAAGAMGHNFFLRGMGEFTVDIINGGAHFYMAWDLALYGPWRIYNANPVGLFSTNGKVTINDGVVMVGEVSGAAGFASVVRCFVSLSGSGWAQFTAPLSNVAYSYLGNPSGGFIAQNGPLFTNNIIVVNGTAMANAIASSTYIDNVTDAANFGGLASNGGAAPIDGGGQRYGQTFAAIPAWNDPDLSKFNLFPTHGVGSGGCWAEPIPLHVDINDSYDGTTPRTGDASTPADITDLAAATGTYAYNEFRLRGSRLVMVGVNVAIDTDNQILDGADEADPSLSDRWAIDAAAANFGFAGFSGTNNVFRRLAIRQGTIATNNVGMADIRHYFHGCYFRHSSAVHIDPGRSTTLYFRGCTFYTPLMFCEYNTNGLFLVFDSCVFFDTVFETDHIDLSVSFYKCIFVGKSQADISAACAFPPNFTGCRFGQTALQYPPTNPADVSRSNMSYYQYGFPIISDATSLAEFVAKEFNIGFGEDTRYGYGAFYFGPLTLLFTTAPDHGVAPLVVQFTPGGTWSGAIPTSFAWEFGDGAVSSEQSPTHTYTMPGVRYPKVTVTFNNGSSLTYVGDPIYVYDTDYSPGTPNPSRTDTCYRTPVLPGDGYGPSEYADGDHPGYDWIWPAARVGLATCYDEVNKEVIIGWDAKTQLRYQLNDPDAWKDRESVGGYPGNRIISEIHHKADAASAGEHAAIVHTEHHSYFKPFDPLKHDTTGYDSEGYPTDMRVDSSVHINGVPDVAAAITRRIPKDGDLVFTERIEARSIQLRKRIFEAPWFYTGTRIDYEALDKAARPSLRLMAEESYQDELSSGPLFHVSRSFIPTINRATGVACAGSADTTVVGPDGMDRSAIGFLPASAGLSDTLVARLAGDFSALVWTKWSTVGVLPQRLWTVGVLEVSIELVGGQRMLVVDDAINPVMMDILPGTGIDWEHVAIVRSGLYLRVYADGVLLGQHALSTSADYGDSLSRCGGDGIGIADALIVPRAVSVEALEYYVEDVTIRNGRQCLPEY